MDLLARGNPLGNDLMIFPLGFRQAVSAEVMRLVVKNYIALAGNLVVTEFGGGFFLDCNFIFHGRLLSKRVVLLVLQ
jgi:hypothetical protein